MKAQQIHQWFLENKKTLAFAESCTGGNLSSQMTALADASKYFLGSVVSYSNLFKSDLLKVSEETLRVHGAVSREVANEMLLGLMKFSDADFGIAITGIAGPSGGTKEKPVGTVFIALGEKGKKPHIVECHFTGDRKKVIEQACDKALEELLTLVRS